jgi:Yip1 domain
MEMDEGWAPPVAEAAPEPLAPVPWEDPELPVLAGLVRTLGQVLFRPGEFFAHLGGEGWAQPLAFGLIATSLGLLGACFWQLLVRAPAGFSLGWPAALMAGAPVLALANLGLGGLCWWGSVALAGAGRDFTPAWRIFCYAQGGMVLGLIPIFGMPVAGIWVLALMYCGMKQVYGISTGGSLGALFVFLSLQAVLALFFLGLAGALTFLGLMAWLG